MTKPSSSPQPRVSSLRTIVDPTNTDDVIDRGVVVYYPAPKSYTGEDVVELQVHGSIAVVRDLLNSLQKLDSFSPAEPGDFTKRAWMNGKFHDLTMLEAVSDLLHAETSAQRKQAQSQLHGALGELYSKWSLELSTCLAHMEAVIDFGDDEMLASDVAKNVTPRVKALVSEIKRHLNDGHKGEILRNGITVCLSGRPNAGKSSLLNLLSNRDASIVSPEAGTTRDIVEVRLDLAGYPLILQDTAGVREDEGVNLVEKEGIRRAMFSFANANIRVLLVDVKDLAQTETTAPNSNPSLKFLQEKILSLANLDPSEQFGGNTIIVLNKADEIDAKLGPEVVKVQAQFEQQGLAVCRISCKNGDGIDKLLEQITMSVKQYFETRTFEGPLMTRMRHRQHLNECVKALESYLEDDEERLMELSAEIIRVANRSICKLTGKVDVEQLLDIVFRDFCIGK